ncbi:tRNA pseudouridine(38-40) synthase TruA [Halobacteriales archaeon SW_7_71_33]|nr:MAG: tRNA pseudouridine(38-40) synthase TruA [Halobacteriales archaeon SW_7_71_33]
MRAFRLAYDGRPFHGFQRQPDVPTVEGALLEALAALGRLDAVPGTPTRPTPPGYAAAGRTDAGVSALEQTVAFEAPDWLTPRALNAELPPAVRAWASADVSGFHATHDASWRAYRYFLHAPTVDAAAARDLLAQFEGAVDLHNLTATPEGDTVRTVRETDARRDGAFLVVDVRADGFLHESVRRLVRYLCRRLDPASEAPSPERLLSTAGLDGPEGVEPAAPEPLVLRRVHYEGVEFEADETALADLRSTFDERRRRAAARERVLGVIADDRRGE